jgi:translocation and assembly module TamB
MKIAKRITGIVLLGVMLLVTVVGYWLAATTPGLRFVLGEVVRYTHLPLTYTNLQGSIVTTIRADKATYDADSVKVVIDDFTTEFALRPLLRLRLDFSNVGASRVDVLLQDNGAASDYDQQGNDTVAAADQQSGLPVSILIHRTAIKQINVFTGSQQPVTFTNVSMASSTIRENFQFEKLAFSRAEGQFSTTGEIGFDMEAPLSLDVQWATNATDTLPAMSGAGSINGSYRKLEAKTTIDKPEKLSVSATVDQPFADISWQGTLIGDSLALSLVNPSLSTKLQKLALQLSGTASSITVTGNATIRDRQYGNWSAALDGTVGADQWVLRHLQLASLDNSATLHLQGKSGENFDYSQQAPFDAEMSWTDAQWPPHGEANIRSSRGEAAWSGSISQYRLKVNHTDVQWQDYAVSELSADAAGGVQSMSLSSYSAGYLNGRWAGSGRVNWSNGLSWQLENAFSKVDPSRQWEKWPASLRGKARVTGTLKNGDWSVDAAVTNLAGTLRSLPIDHAAFSLAAANDQYKLRNVTFRSGNNRLQGAAQLNTSGAQPQIVANWNVAAGNLSQLLPDTSGEFHSRGTIKGTLTSPALSLSVHAKQLAVGDYKLAALDASAGVDPEPDGKLHLDLQAAGFSYQTWQMQHARIQATGTTARHTIKIKTRVNPERIVDMLAAGGYSDTVWSGKLISTDVSTELLGQWYQPQPVKLLVSGGKLQLDHWCLALRKSPSKTCLTLDSQGFTAWQGKLILTALSTQRLKAFFPQMISETEGVFNGDARFDIDGIHINNLSAQLTSKEGMLVYGFQDTERQKFKYQQLDFSVNHNKAGIKVSANVDMLGKGKITGNLLLKDKHTIGPIAKSQYLQGRMVIDLNDLAILHLLYPEVQFKEGRKYSEFTVSGQLGKPVFVGYTTVSIKSALLPRLGIELKDANLRFDYDGKYGITAKGRVSSGDGYVNLEGKVTDYLTDNLQATLKIQGKNFRAANTAEITAAVSPDLTLSLKNNVLKMRGELDIPSTDVKILDSPGSVSPSSDVVMIDERKKEQKTPKKQLSFDAEVRVKLGQLVRFQGFGAKGRLTGEVVVREETSGEATGSGEISIVDGKFSAYKTELDIEKGKLVYASSPIDNPLVDIRAQRKVNDDTIVGVDVSGYAQEPKLNLYSEPAMDNADILSYMILGYPIGQATQKEGSVLASAAASIGLVGGEILAKSIAKEFGIDEVKVETDYATKETSLVLGKYLSPRLIASYAVGIGQTANVFRLEYQLTKQWVLKTETTSEGGGSTDLLYTIER